MYSISITAVKNVASEPRDNPSKELRCCIHHEQVFWGINVNVAFALSAVKQKKIVQREIASKPFFFFFFQGNGHNRVCPGVS